MEPPAPVRPRPGPARVRRFAPALVVVVVLAVVAATGGLAAAPPLGVRRFVLGEPVDLRRWVVVVDGVELVDTDAYGSAAPPTLQVRLDVTWTGKRTEPDLATSLVTVLVPGGPPTAADPSSPTVSGYFGGFDPDVARPVLLDYVWPADAKPDQPRGALPADVDVVLRDERPAQNFLFSDEWTTTRPVGHVVAPVLDRRRR